MSPSISKGFTLIELLAVITILGVISIFITPRLPVFATSINESKVTLINALKTARKTALFSTEPNTEIQLILSENRISLRKNNRVIKDLGYLYSNTDTQSIKHTPENLILSFNHLGETQKTTITLRSKTAEESVIIYPTGFIE